MSVGALEANVSLIRDVAQFHFTFFSKTWKRPEVTCGHFKCHKPGWLGWDVAGKKTRSCPLVLLALRVWRPFYVEQQLSIVGTWVWGLWTPTQSENPGIRSAGAVIWVSSQMQIRILQISQQNDHETFFMIIMKRSSWCTTTDLSCVIVLLNLCMSALIFPAK